VIVGLEQSMRRREFITLLGSTATTWPLAALAQQSTLPIVGFVNGGAADASERYLAGFRKGLSETGYIEGRNVAVEYHWLEGQYDRLPALMADLVQRQVAVIATPGSIVATAAAKSATSTIPIVFGAAGDPVKLGLVMSLSRPGGNATGTNFFAFEVASKQLGLLHELVPQAGRIAILLNPNASSSIVEQAVQDTARALGLKTIVFKAGTPTEIDAAFASFAGERADALFIEPDGFFSSRRVQIATLAMRDRLPASYVSREMVQAGLLMSYGTNIAESFRQVGIYTGTILKGVQPADLPVIQATKFEFVINLQTAKSLGLDVSPGLLARADEVIE
jgi:putative tryptophan/tyrosine transport system substrate-binding protein